MTQVRDGAQNVHHQPRRTLISDDATDEWMAAAITTRSNLAHSILIHCCSSSRSVMRVLYTFSCNNSYTL